MYGDFILDFKDKRIQGSKPKKVISSENTNFHDLAKAIDQPAYGFLSYDCCRFVEQLPNQAQKDIDTPDFLFLVPETISIALKPTRRKTPNFKPQTSKQIKSNFNKQQFKEIVIKAKEYIRAGDIYQVNLSQRLEVALNCEPLELYRRLSTINPSPFASYFDFGGWQIISCSPERLIKLENGLAETRPIAGTRPISATEEELLLDPKERAEHIMLVDLERNDLGRACEYGSVHVDENMIIEKYSHVIHIVSNVRGKLKKDKNWFDLLKAMFPGGTITGCPKIRSMEIIEELEPIKRGLYTGSIGYIDPLKQSMDLNIVIRTIIVRGNKAYIQVGAGIVADSDPEKEYFETLHKAQAMVEALKS
ncbi:anthranilate synthase component I family protein [Candidatus Margulisiibacteriota bacterium]